MRFLFVLLGCALCFCLYPLSPLRAQDTNKAKNADSVQAFKEIEKIGVFSARRTNYSEHIWKQLPREKLLSYLNQVPNILPAVIHKEFVTALLLKAAPEYNHDEKLSFYDWRLRKLIDLGAYEESERLYEARRSKPISNKANELGYLASLYQGKFDKVCLNIKTSTVNFDSKTFKQDLEALCSFISLPEDKKETATVPPNTSSTLKEWLLSDSDDATPLILDEFNNLPEHLRAIAVSQKLIQITLDLKDTRLKDINNHALWLMWQNKSPQKLNFVDAEMIKRGLISVSESKIGTGKYLQDAVESRIKTSVRINNPAYLTPIHESSFDMDLSHLSTQERIQLDISLYMFGNGKKRKATQKHEGLSPSYPIKRIMAEKQPETQQLQAWHAKFCGPNNDINQLYCQRILLSLPPFLEQQAFTSLQSLLFYEKKINQIFLTNYVIPLYIYTDLSHTTDSKRKLDLSLIKLLLYSSQGLSKISPVDMNSVIKDILDFGDKDLARKIMLNIISGF